MSEPRRRFDASRIDAFRKELFGQRLSPFYGRVCTKGVADEIHRTVAGVLKCSIKVVRQSLVDLTGYTLSEHRLHSAIYRLIANYPLLRAGTPVPCWTGALSQDIWVPAQARGLRHEKSGVAVRFQVLGGPPAGEEARVFWTRKLAKYVAYRVLGFGGGWKKTELNYRDPREIVNLRLWALVSSEKTNQLEIKFVEYASSPSFVTWNRKLISRRNRKNFQCPKGFAHRCYKCHIGYDQCPLATHAITRKENDNESNPASHGSVRGSGDQSTLQSGS